MPVQSIGCPFQIGRVPKHDGRRYQIEAAGPVALLLKTAVADFAQSVEEHRPGQRVARLAFVESGLHAAAQLHALQPIQYEQRALNAPQLAQCNGQSVLTRIGELALNDIADSRQGPMIVSGNALENIDWRTFPEESKHISGSSCVVSKCEGLVHRLYMRASQDTASFDS